MLASLICINYMLLYDLHDCRIQSISAGLRFLQTDLSGCVDFFVVLCMLGFLLILQSQSPGWLQWGSLKCGQPAHQLA